MGRFVIRRQGVLYYGGVAPSRQNSWTGKVDRATKFKSREEAEGIALLIASGEQPELIGALDVVDLDEWERQNAKHG